MSETSLECRVTLRVADETRGPWALPQWDELRVGRAEGAGLRIPEGWVPRGLVRFLPVEPGWVMHNGPRARVRVRNEYVGDVYFAPKALVALQEGRTLISWPELDDTCQLGVVIGHDAAGGLRTLENGSSGADESVGTDYAARNMEFQPQVRQMLAVLFSHLLTGHP